MGDGELRALERRWHETGEVEDEARWHLARVRAGALPQARLELAALLGVPGALSALNRRRVPKPPGSPEGLRAWLGEVEAHGAEATRRAGLAVAGLHLADALREQRRDAEARAEEAARVGVELQRGTPNEMDALLDGVFEDAWRGDEALLRAARAWFDGLVRAALRPDDATAQARLRTLDQRFRLEGLVARSRADGPLRSALRLVDALAEPGAGVDAWFAPPPARRVVDVHGAIAAALGPWALGLRDPLAATLEVGLDAAEIAAPCPVAWEAMRPTDDPATRRCTRCSLDVLDLSALTRPEAEARLAQARRGAHRRLRRGPGREPAPAAAELHDARHAPPVVRAGRDVGHFFGDV
jgi:hypothetical protein